MLGHRLTRTPAARPTGQISNAVSGRNSDAVDTSPAKGPYISTVLGRVVTSLDGQPETFPVNYVVRRRTVLFRTAEGTKLVSTATNHHMLFEVDDHNVAEGWSVIVKGIARSLRATEQIEEAERAQLLPWTTPEKTNYVRVIPEMVTGRRFRFGPPLEKSDRA